MKCDLSHTHDRPRPADFRDSTAGPTNVIRAADHSGGRSVCRDKERGSDT